MRSLATPAPSRRAGSCLREPWPQEKVRGTRAVRLGKWPREPVSSRAPRWNTRPPPRERGNRGATIMTPGQFTQRNLEGYSLPSAFVTASEGRAPRGCSADRMSSAVASVEVVPKETNQPAASVAEATKALHCDTDRIYTVR